MLRVEETLHQATRSVVVCLGDEILRILCLLFFLPAVVIGLVSSPSTHVLRFTFTLVEKNAPFENHRAKLVESERQELRDVEGALVRNEPPHFMHPTLFRLEYLLVVVLENVHQAHETWQCIQVHCLLAVRVTLEADDFLFSQHSE